MSSASRYSCLSVPPRARYLTVAAGRLTRQRTIAIGASIAASHFGRCGHAVRDPAAQRLTLRRGEFGEQFRIEPLADDADVPAGGNEAERPST